MEDLQSTEQIQRTFQAVQLESLKGIRKVDAEISMGDTIGEESSGIVRQAVVRIIKGDNIKEYPVAVKSYHDQEDKPELTADFNRAYKSQLVLWEALRRAEVNVIPTFRLARNESGNILGIVMTYLQLKSLTDKEIDRVTTSKADIRGNLMSQLSQKQDRRKAEGLGLKLANDSWMLQYSKYWGFASPMPKAVVSDIIDIEIADRDKFKIFLSKEENADLLAETKNTLLLA